MDRGTSMGMVGMMGIGRIGGMYRYRNGCEEADSGHENIEREGW